MDKAVKACPHGSFENFGNIFRRRPAWRRTLERVPVGIRGPLRSQRRAAWCPPEAIGQIVTPTDLLNRVARTRDSQASLALRSLQLLAVDWQWFTHSCWGPGGSVGFELATGKRTTTPQSDLDIVIYANEHLSKSEAQRLLVSTRDLEVAVDIRIETPLCGFLSPNMPARLPSRFCSVPPRVRFLVTIRGTSSRFEIVIGLSRL